MRRYEEPISIHAPPRGATKARALADLEVLFQFTPLREGRPRPYPALLRPLDFNSRPSARGDAVPAAPKRKRGNFNSRPSARGDRSGCACSVVGGIFQFTPLREGRPERMRLQRGWGDISIHAPPRGATAPYVPSGTGRKISIHAPPRGATTRNTPARRFRLFQFTPLREGRLGLFCVTVFFECISIHAPPRGATAPAAHREAVADISIHAPPRGATLQPCLNRHGTKFQFTPLREGRLGKNERCHENQRHFNSRPSARGDTKKHFEEENTIFQFTPLREGRRRPAL